MKKRNEKRLKELYDALLDAERRALDFEERLIASRSREAVLHQQIAEMKRIAMTLTNDRNTT